VKQLVTGGAGFLGAALVERLLGSGVKGLRIQVRASTDTARLMKVLSRYSNSTWELATGSLESAKDVRDLLDGVGLVYHLAAAKRGSPAAIARQTIASSRNLLDAVLAMDPKPRMVLISSFGVYRVAALAPGDELTEDTALEDKPHLRDPYSHAKLEQERIFRAYHRRHGVPLTIVRPGVIYGPGHLAPSDRVGLRLSAGCLLGIGGKNLLPLTYVDNCAEAVRYAGEHGRFDGDTYNAIDADLVTCGEYLRRYRETGARLFVIPLPFAAMLTLARGYAALRRVLGGRGPVLITPYHAASTWKTLRFGRSALEGLGYRQIVSTQDAMGRLFVRGPGA
jgi:nucleoside-diphosphate-sugar epimerase